MIKRLKPGMFFITPVEDGHQRLGFLVSRDGRNWKVWVSGIEDGKSIEPFMLVIPGSYIRNEWLDKHNYELYI